MDECEDLGCRYKKKLEKIGKPGLFKNKDGTVSDRLVWIMMLLSTELIICLYWAFSEQPLPGYSKDILLANVPVLMTLIGAQSYENVKDKKYIHEIEEKIEKIEDNKRKSKTTL